MLLILGHLCKSLNYSDLPYSAAIKKYILSAVLLFFISFSSIETAYCQYTINNTFSNTNDFDYVTDGIFIVWWDNEWDDEDDALNY